jgi:hypothetical protein
MRYADPDPGGQNWHTKIEKSFEFSCFFPTEHFFEVIFCHQSPGPGTGSQSASGFAFRSASCDVYFSTFKEPRNWFQEIDTPSICSLAGRYDSHTSTRFPSYHRLNENECARDFDQQQWSQGPLKLCRQLLSQEVVLKSVAELGLYGIYCIFSLLITCFLMGLFFSSSKACGPGAVEQDKEWGGDD